MSGESETFIHVLGLGLDPAWRRRDDAERRADAQAFLAAHDAAPGHGVTSVAYSTIGLEPSMDVLFWRTARSLDALEQAASLLLRCGVGRSMTVREALIGRVGPSQYVARPSAQEQATGWSDPSRYLIVYPFTKSADWYLLPREVRQGVMNEHMRIGHEYPTVRQALAYSFGLDDQEFIVAYDTDELGSFSDLVRALRATEGRRSTVRDTPLMLGIRRPVAEILELLGAPA